MIFQKRKVESVICKLSRFKERPWNQQQMLLTRLHGCRAKMCSSMLLPANEGAIEDVVETEHQEFRFKNNLPNGVLILLQEMAFVT